MALINVLIDVFSGTRFWVQQASGSEIFKKKSYIFGNGKDLACKIDIIRKYIKALMPYSKEEKIYCPCRLTCRYVWRWISKYSNHSH